jgi:hypothetical protein
MTVTIRMENTYEDGHESTSEHVLDNPEDPENLEDWWEDYVWELTGDGHGADNPKLGSLHEATIIKADDESLVGQSMEW